MNRRTALKQVALLVGGAALLPGCRFGQERVAMALTNLQIDADHQDLLARVVETFIPSGETPGAKELEIPEFVMVMVDDCVRADDQTRFVNGLQRFEPFVKQNFGKSFRRGDQAFRERVLTDTMARKDDANSNLGEVQTFLSLTKRYASQGFLSSEYVLTEKLPYVHIPGPFQACVRVDEVKVS